MIKASLSERLSKASRTIFISRPSLLTAAPRISSPTSCDARLHVCIRLRRSRAWSCVSAIVIIQLASTEGVPRTIVVRDQLLGKHITDKPFPPLYFPTKNHRDSSILLCHHFRCAHYIGPNNTKPKPCESISFARKKRTDGRLPLLLEARDTR